MATDVEAEIVPLKKYLEKYQGREADPKKVSSDKMYYIVV